ncbi:hypothetical protein DACRYDRAFT_20607 [Dacryopinax primogenitus]|uniref:Pali-domain-containing protein n=1 Tax=Dacryopinax primogenitus (strain DJM 731) TaxID=1858805 RepID=M5G8I3_DACPD|nr:uncharacterized protein DACRYDRAFT_20607 [Dacryopinax primogenitus]EJU05059.1 hypothetical protein DACRYDRAFT_20607 [Dacryopinax primogenitus]
MAFFHPRHAYNASWLLLIVAFIFLLLCSISVPVVHSLYFMSSDISGGSRYGMWGWCDYDLGYCWGNYLYWGFDPFFVVWMTRVLVFYPISCILTFLTILALIPASARSEGHEPRPLAIYPALAGLTCLCTIVAWCFSMAMFAIARDRLRADGFSADFGACMWLGLIAMLCMIVVSWLGLWSGRAKTTY